MNTHLTLSDTTQMVNPSTFRKDFLVKPNKETPFVKFNGSQGVLLIKGNSTENDLLKFYSPVVTLIKEYLKDADKLTCYFFLKDFNQQTASILFDIFRTLKAHKEAGKKITINWFADWHNNEMIETGVDFSDLYDLNINIMPI